MIWIFHCFGCFLVWFLCGFDRLIFIFIFCIDLVVGVVVGVDVCF